MKSKQFFLNVKDRIIGHHHVEEKLFSFSDTEKAEQKFYIDYLHPGMIAFDVGANIGEISLLFSRFVGENGSVHSFEPSTETYLRLEKIVKASERSNITINNVAVSDHNGLSKFYVYDHQHAEWNGLSNRPLEKYGISIDQPEAIEVKTLTVDQYCSEHDLDRIDLLKIDVEGAEYQVLRGAKRMMSEKRIRCCIFEFGQTTFDMGNSPQQISALIKEYGYSIKNLFPEAPIFPGGDDAMTARFAMLVCRPQETVNSHE